MNNYQKNLKTINDTIEIFNCLYFINSSQMVLNINDDNRKFQENLTNKYNNTVSVVKSKISDEFCEQGGNKYLIKYLQIAKNTEKKPISINQIKFVDPFAPPIKEDMLIEDNFFGLNEHRLMFTKFPLFKEQVLLVSRDFKSQYTHLTLEDFRDIIILINSINGCGFFNGGEKAGASQPRKHLQAFPYKSFPNQNNDFGIFRAIRNELNLIHIKININASVSFGNFYKLLCLDGVVPHLLFKFSEDFRDRIKKNKLARINGQLCLWIYDILAANCELFSYEGEKKLEKIEKDFSFLITDEFMFICRRKAHDIFITENDAANNDIINLNSLALFFIIVSRSPHQIEELKNGNIIKDVYTKL